MNAVLYGYAKNGVPWVKTPRNLMIALVSSLATFFLWPILCESMAQERLRRIQDMAKSRSWWDTAWYRATNPISFTASSPENITRAEFVAACEASAADEADSFYKTICRALVPKLKDQASAIQPTASQLFDLIDLNGDGVLDVFELERLVLLEYNGSTARYMVDTVALGASAIVGPSMAISRGLHPVVCAVSGVTICFGGILRDLICKQDVALGGQSFAASTAAGASVYVILRELCIKGYSIPLPLRAALAAGTTVSVRVADYYAEGKLLPPMHGRPASVTTQVHLMTRTGTRQDEPDPSLPLAVTRLNNTTSGVPPEFG